MEAREITFNIRGNIFYFLEAFLSDFPSDSKIKPLLIEEFINSFMNFFKFWLELIGIESYHQINSPELINLYMINSKAALYCSYKEIFFLIQLMFGNFMVAQNKEGQNNIREYIKRLRISFEVFIRRIFVVL